MVKPSPGAKLLSYPNINAPGAAAHDPGVLFVINEQKPE
jgi:hypothetical protein